MIRAFGWTTVLAPVKIIQCDDDNKPEGEYNVLDIVAKANGPTDSDITPDFTLNTNNSSGSNFSTGEGGINGSLGNANTG